MGNAGVTDGSPFFARNVSSAVFRFTVCSVGNRGFFGEGLNSFAGAGIGECDRERLPSSTGVPSLVVGVPEPKKPSIPLCPSSSRSRPLKESAIY